MTAGPPRSPSDDQALDLDHGLTSPRTLALEPLRASAISRPTMSAASERWVDSDAVDRRDRAPRAKDGDPIRDRHHLVQLVRDDDHGVPSCAMTWSVRKRPSDSCGVRTAVGSSRTSTREPRKTALTISTALLLADRELPDARVGIDGHLQRLGYLAQLPAAGLRPSQKRGVCQPSRTFSATVSVSDEPEVLVHHPDPRRERVARPSKRRVAVELDLALVGPVQAGEDVHEGRLARAVLAEQRVHLAHLGLEVDAVVREHAREALRDPAHRHRRDRRGAGRAGASRVDRLRGEVALPLPRASPSRFRSRP